jgi:glycine dehydrogenase subunit 2
MNFGVDSGMYPLGSCTMKYNPKINERAASRDGFTQAHPLAGDDSVQGSLRVMYQLGEYLSTITGMCQFSLQPAAGAHGELTGVMMIKKYFENRGERRSVILIPDTAHGTNPASVAICGFEVKQVPSTLDGDVDIEALQNLCDESVAAMMLTCPNTLGLFDRNTVKISEILHAKGALYYCDGANLNALLGITRIADLGFDLMHVNLHKTFATPHGGGGPGSGPVGVTEKLERFLPVPVIRRDGEKYFMEYNRSDSIGRVHSFYGNFLVMVKAYAYILSLGKQGMAEVSGHAVLNAHYLSALLRTSFNLPINRGCMHEFVLNDDNLPNGVTTNDIAKRILDYGYHSPTIYFPLLIHGAIMIEPTETENKRSLDEFAAAMEMIRDEINTSPDIVKTAPQNTSVKRVDAVLAARKPVLREPSLDRK